jgi:uncharacterized repeat protein (TIGR03803 family)
MKQNSFCFRSPIRARRLIQFTVVALLIQSAHAGTPRELVGFSNGPFPTELTADSSGAYYGTTERGGDYNLGSIFRVTTNGTLSTLVSLEGWNGAGPVCGLALGPDGAFYGTATFGGTSGRGTVFRVTTNGQLTMLFSFTGTNGLYPGNYPTRLISASDGALYGATHSGGSANGGSVFRVTTNGIFSSLVSFSGANAGFCDGLTEVNPGVFYGSAAAAGINHYGTIFRVTSAGVLTPIAAFSSFDGVQPRARLLWASDKALYGVTYQGGTYGGGTIFKCTTNGSLTSLASFQIGTGGGYYPRGTLVEVAGAIYGTTQLGGPTYDGTVFKLLPGGTPTTIHDFNAALDGQSPADLTVGADSKLYGICGSGGPADAGTAFSITTGGSLTTLATFVNPNGSALLAGLVKGPDNFLYGLTSAQGNFGRGTAFRIGSNGALTTLFSFTAANGGVAEHAMMLGQDGNFYGTTRIGGTTDSGTAFRLTTDGTLTTLLSFSLPNGTAPTGTLVQDANGALYGVTTSGGSMSSGTAFRLTTNGAVTWQTPFGSPNGSLPQSGLAFGDDGALYGTTGVGGNQNAGTIFRLTTNGVLSTLMSFNAAASQGMYPRAPLTRGPGGVFYGTTYFTSSGNSGYGTVFCVTTNGFLTTLTNFGGFPQPGYPTGPLVFGSDGALYGTTISGGSSGSGSIYRITTNGVLTTLVSFASSAVTGSGPFSGVLPDLNGEFFGTAQSGGSYGGGNVFHANLISHMQSLARTGNSCSITFKGISGNSYRVQRSPGMLTGWTTLGTATPNGVGDGTYSDSSSPATEAYYRTVFP